MQGRIERALQFSDSKGRASLVFKSYNAEPLSCPASRGSARPAVFSGDSL